MIKTNVSQRLPWRSLQSSLIEVRRLHWLAIDKPCDHSGVHHVASSDGFAKQLNRRTWEKRVVAWPLVLPLSQSGFLFVFTMVLFLFLSPCALSTVVPFSGETITGGRMFGAETHKHVVTVMVHFRSYLKPNNPVISIKAYWVWSGSCRSSTCGRSCSHSHPPWEWEEPHGLNLDSHTQTSVNPFEEPGLTVT